MDISVDEHRDSMTAVGRITDLSSRDWKAPPIAPYPSRIEQTFVTYLLGLHKTGEWVRLCQIDEAEAQRVIRNCHSSTQPEPGKLSIRFDDFSAFTTENSKVSRVF